MPQWNTADPGCTTMSAPAIPAETASQRPGSTRSPRSGPERATMKRGPVKLMAVASASGR